MARARAFRPFLVLGICIGFSSLLGAQEVRQVLDMAFPAEGTIARLHVDLRGNPHGGWPTVVGDVNGDGRDDLVWVRWSWEEDTWPESLLVFGGPHLVGVTGKAITEAPHARLLHPRTDERLLPRCWRSVAPTGDADGFDDFLFAACGFNEPGAEAAGRVILIFGQPTFPVEAELADLSASGIRSLTIVARDAGLQLGLSLNRIGDLNGVSRRAP